MPDQKPTIGRIVHFVTTRAGLLPWAHGARNGDEIVELAAIIADVHDRGVNLTVFGDPDPFYRRDVPQNEAKAPGSWHWPEREDAKPESTDKGKGDKGKDDEKGQK